MSERPIAEDVRLAEAAVEAHCERFFVDVYDLSPYGVIELTVKALAEAGRLIKAPTPARADDEANRSPFYGMPLCPHRIQFGCSQCAHNDGQVCE